MIRPLLPRRFTLPGSGSRPVQRWADYRRQQRDTWRASNRLGEARDPAGTESATPASGDGPSPEPGQTATTESFGYGAIGRPLNRQSPFYLGFVGAIGALVAYGLVHPSRG